jgi:hypothetical protein
LGFSHSPDADRASLTGDPDDIPREAHHTTPEMLEAELKVLFPKVGEEVILMVYGIRS